MNPSPLRPAPSTSLNNAEARAILDGLAGIERFAAALTDSAMSLSLDTLRAGLDDIRIHAQRLRERGGE